MYVFEPGLHDEFICFHVLSGVSPEEPVEHVYHEDGSVSVYFPAEANVKERIATYNRGDYEVIPESIEDRVKRLEETVIEVLPEPVIVKG